MIDNNFEFLYYIIKGKLYKKQNQMIGVLSYEEKNRGVKRITEYRESAVRPLQRFLLQLFRKA